MKDENIPQMRQELAEQEFKSVGDGQIIDILIDGCEGYANMDDEEIRKLYRRFFK